MPGADLPRRELTELHRAELGQDVAVQEPLVELHRPRPQRPLGQPGGGVGLQRDRAQGGVHPRPALDVALDAGQPPRGIALQRERVRRHDELVGPRVAVLGLPPARGQPAHRAELSPAH